MAADGKYLPQQAPIEAAGDGGFRFAGMSHRGSILSLPSGIRAWPVARPGDITEAALAPLIAEARDVELLLIGSGTDPWAMPEALRLALRDRRIGVDVMTTRAAVRTYNILLDERRRIAAGLIAVD